MINDSVPTSPNEERQKELDNRRKQGNFKDIDPKLTRADIEWLLQSQQKTQGLNLQGATLRGVDLHDLSLGLCYEKWVNETVEDRKTAATHLEGADLEGACLEKARCDYVHLERATLREAHLKEATLRRAHLEQATLRKAHLEGVDLRGAFFDSATQLDGVFFSNKQSCFLRFLLLSQIGRWCMKTLRISTQYNAALLADVRWNSVNLAVVKWSEVIMLGDEYVAQQRSEYEEAVRANRQLATVLQEQGLNEDAARFTYRAQVLQRKVFKLQVREGQVRQLGAFLFSLFLALLTGYGYRIWRIFAAYGLLICLFAIFYYFNLGSDHLTWYQQVYAALVVSITAFHGRTYAGQYGGPGTVLGGVAALEGIFGLVIEGVFIAMLVQRFFGK